MKNTVLISILLSVIVLPCFNQQSSESEKITSGAQVECTPGITSFGTSGSMEMLDSVVHYAYQEDHSGPNISKKYFYFDENDLLDSIVERYQDNIYEYVSGYTVSYSYEGTGRLAGAFKSSWNDQISHLLILISETYNYDASGNCTRNSVIEWRTANDTSSLDVQEDYTYDTTSMLAGYTMKIPPEINPDNAVYKEDYRYDSIGGLSYKRKDLSEAGQRRTLVETMYQNAYLEQNLPWYIRSSRRENGQGDWQEDGQWRYSYDDNNRNTLLTATRQTDNGPAYMKKSFTYDGDNVIREVSYISADSIHYQLSDSILYYYASSGSGELEEEEEEEEEEEFEEEEFPAPSDPLEFKLFPNPTDGILHVRSGIDFPATVRVIDASGKIVFSKRIENGVTDIDLSPYPTGYYIITLTSHSDYQTGKVFRY